MTIFCLAISSTPDSYGSMGRLIPDLKIKTLEGDTIDLAETVQGKAAVINFTTTWCFDCKKLSDRFKTLIPEFRNREVDFYFIYVGQKKKLVKRNMRGRSAQSMPVLLLDEKRKASGRLKITSVPHLIMVNQEGAVTFEGFTQDEKKLRKTIQSLVPESSENK